MTYHDARFDKDTNVMTFHSHNFPNLELEIGEPCDIPSHIKRGPVYGIPQDFLEYMKREECSIWGWDIEQDHPDDKMLLNAWMTGNGKEIVVGLILPTKGEQHDTPKTHQ